ncbi:MAG: hypothetical protein VSS75_032960 [Candidatus Parabeggiatoa sp.]|nr:hypothetical protein [Candidatus Parabeggiatoa sp.]
MSTMFTLELTQSAYRHLEAFKLFDRNQILDGIKAQLSYQPLERKTKNGFAKIL